MIEGLAGGVALQQFQGPARPGAQVGSTEAPTAGSASITVAASGSDVADGVGAAETPPDRSVQQPPRAESPGPENDFGQRGGLLDITA